MYMNNVLISFNVFCSLSKNSYCSLFCSYIRQKNIYDFQMHVLTLLPSILEYWYIAVKYKINVSLQGTQLSRFQLNGSTICPKHTGLLNYCQVINVFMYLFMYFHCPASRDTTYELAGELSTGAGMFSDMEVRFFVEPQKLLERIQSVRATA